MKLLSANTAAPAAPSASLRPTSPAPNQSPSPSCFMTNSHLNERCSHCRTTNETAKKLNVEKASLVTTSTLSTDLFYSQIQ